MSLTITAVIRFCFATYFLYGIGYAVPSLRDDLGLSAGVAGLHASAAALGLIASGIAGHRLAERLGEGSSARFAMAFVATGAVVFTVAGMAWLSLAGALVIGFSAGLAIAWANHRLSAPGGRQAVLLLARANVAALVSALAAPLAIAAGIALGLGGRGGLLLALPILALTEWIGRQDRPIGTAQSVAASVSQMTVLPRAYWRWWLVLALAIGIEFSIVFWSSSVLRIKTGADIPLATTTAAAFLVGMIVVRSSLGVGIGAGVDRSQLMLAGFGVAIVGVIGAWQAQSLVFGAGALFVAGLGVGPLYPVGIAIALGAGRVAPLAAAARATLASGTAILIAPFALAILAEQIGLEAAWPTIAVLAVGGMILVVGRTASIARTRVGVD